MTKFLLMSLFFILIHVLSCSTVKKESLFEIPPYQVETLENGLELYIFQDRRLPTIAFYFVSHSGQRYDPSGQAGVASLTPYLFEKGSKSMTATQIAKAIDQLGSDWSVAVDQDSVQITLSGLSLHQDQMAQIFSELILQPSFPDHEIERLKKQTLAQIQNSIDRPESMVDSATSSILFESHPYGRTALRSRDELSRLTRRQILEFYSHFYQPSRARIAVVGAIDDSTLQSLRRQFSQWKDKKIISSVIQKPKPLSESQIHLFVRDDLQQAQVRLGHQGIKRNDPDFIPLRLVNTILGGTFSSRLMKKIRVEKGLTYGISSQWSAGLDSGSFLVATFTRNDKVGDIVSESLNVIQDFYAQGITKEELESTRSYLKGVFPRAIETREMLAFNILNLKIYGLSEDYLKTYLSELDRLTVSHLNQVIKSHFQPQLLQIVVYGPSSAYDQLQLVSEQRKIKLNKNSFHTLLSSQSSTTF